MKRQCVLYDRVCIECGECDRCDLDPTKICDNCMKCVKGNEDFRAIAIDGIDDDEEVHVIDAEPSDKPAE